MTDLATKLASNSFRKVGVATAIPNGFAVPYYLDDRKLRISIARANGRLYAFDEVCTCGKTPCPLSGGLLTGTTIMCQCHASKFDIITRNVINRPATKSLNLYEVQEIDGHIQLQDRSVGVSRRVQ